MTDFVREYGQRPPIAEDFRRSVPDHVTLLSFNSDEDNQRFQEWLGLQGWADFQAWASDNEEGL